MCYLLCNYYSCNLTNTSYWGARIVARPKLSCYSDFLNKEMANQTFILIRSLPLFVPQTFTDAKGNQFFMVAISVGQTLPLMQMAPIRGPMNYSSGSHGGRNQRRGLKYGGHFSRGSTKHSGILMLIVWIVHH